MSNNNYPNYRKNIVEHIKQNKKRKFKRNSAILGVTTFIGVSAVLLFLTSWFFYVFSSLVFAGLLTYVIRHKRLKWIKKIINSIGLVAIFLFVMDISHGDVPWSVMYAGPSLMYACIVIVSLAMLLKKNGWDDFVPVQLLLLALSFFYISLSFILGIIGASLALVFFVAVWIRRGRAYNQVLLGMLHV